MPSEFSLCFLKMPPLLTLYARNGSISTSEGGRQDVTLQLVVQGSTNEGLDVQVLRYLDELHHLVTVNIAVDSGSLYEVIGGNE